MPADELGGVWSSEPVRVTQAVKQVGKEQDRDQHKKNNQDTELPAREQDSVELTVADDDQTIKAVTVNSPSPDNDDLIPGSNIDVTIG